MDIDVFPNTIDYWGPTGMVFYRLPQLRWTPYKTAQSQFAIALERPGNDIDPGQIRQFDPALGSNLRTMKNCSTSPRITTPAVHGAMHRLPAFYDGRLRYIRYTRQ
jgi:hypothetical protein